MTSRVPAETALRSSESMTGVRIDALVAEPPAELVAKLAQLLRLHLPEILPAAEAVRQDREDLLGELASLAVDGVAFAAHLRQPGRGCPPQHRGGLFGVGYRELGHGTQSG